MGCRWRREVQVSITHVLFGSNLLNISFIGLHASFLLYDITRAETLDNIPKWTNIVRQKAGPIPIMLVGAKIDLSPSQRQVMREYGIQIAEKNKMEGFVEISAKENVNVNKAFDVLTEFTLNKMK